MDVTQQHVAHALGVQSVIEVNHEIEDRTRFLVDYAKSVPRCAGFVIGVSGGQDSTLAGKLCQLAAEQLRAEGKHASCYAVRLPYGAQRDEEDAQLALQFIAPDHTLLVNIQHTVDALVAETQQATQQPVSDFTKGNIKARARMMAQYAVAGDRNLLVVGTDHAAEAVTGFYTKFGDGAADVMPLAGLTKRQGAMMLQALGADRRLYEKIPTADLLDDQPGRSDEAELGVSYTEIDDFLEGLEVSQAARDRIVAKYESSEHKRHLPVTPADVWWHTSETRG